MEDGNYVDGSISFYAPNKGAPVFFAVAFCASGLVHVWQCIHYRSWKLTSLYVVCAILFTAGFIARELFAFDYANLVKYIVCVCLVYAGPPLFELANYIVLGRILYYIPYLSPIHPGRVLTTFAAISFIVETLNGMGAAYSANSSLSQSKQNTGKAVIEASLLIQIVVVTLFLLLAGVFHRRVRRAGIQNSDLESALVTLYVSTTLLAIRTIYRVVEYFSVAQLHVGPGFDPMTLSPLVRYEWFFYVFEATLMLTNSVMVNIRHPRRFLPATTKIYLARDGVTEIEGPGYKEQRNFLMTLFDPFDIIGLLSGRDKATRFWEEPGAGSQEAGASHGPKKEVGAV